MVRRDNAAVRVRLLCAVREEFRLTVNETKSAVGVDSSYSETLQDSRDVQLLDELVLGFARDQNIVWSNTNLCADRIL